MAMLKNVCFSNGYVYDAKMVENGIMFTDPAGTQTLIKFTEIYAIRRTRLSNIHMAVIHITLVYNYEMYYKVPASNDLNIKLCREKICPMLKFHNNNVEIKIGRTVIDMRKIDDILYDGVTVKIRLVGNPGYTFIAKCSELEIEAINFVVVNSPKMIKRRRPNRQPEENLLFRCI